MSSRGREAPATVPSMVDSMSDEVVNATAYARVTEAAVYKVKEVLVKIATVNVEDSCVAARSAMVTCQDARLFLKACEESKAPASFGCLTTATVASRGVAAMASRGVAAVAQTNPSLSSMGSRQAARDAVGNAIVASQQTVLKAQGMVEKIKEALELAEEALAAAKLSQAAAETAWTWP